jgi:hypothetical protein
MIAFLYVEEDVVLPEVQARPVVSNFPAGVQAAGEKFAVSDFLMLALENLMLAIL